jgi:hypothetical protein
MFYAELPMRPTFSRPYQACSAEDPDSPGLWTSLARCNAVDLQVLSGIRKFGAKPVSGEEPAQVASELTGPLNVGSHVKTLEVQFGHRITNRSEPPSAFTS